MTRNSYKNLLIESAVADIKKIEVFKSPADKILDSARKGTVTDDVSDIRDAESAIAVLGRIYDAQNEDRPFIKENDDEHEVQGDSEISVDMPDNVASAKIQDIADVIDSDAGCEPNPNQDDEFKKALADDANDNHLDENFVLEDDEDNEPEDLPEDEDDESLPEDDEDSDEGISEDDETLPEDEIEDEDLPEDDEEDECCPDCGKEPCECEDDEEDSDSDEDDEDLDEGCNCEGDDTLPEDELPEDDTESHDEDQLPEDNLPEDDEDGEVTEEGEPDASLDMGDVAAEDVDDSTLDEVEVTGSDEILADDSDTVPAKEIPVDGVVYNEDAEDPAVDPNDEVAAAQTADPTENQVAAPDAETPADDEAPVANGADNASVEDPTVDPNGDAEDKTDPVLDVDSQVVASDTTQESVLESLIRSFKESSDEGYMNYESDDFDSED